MYSGYGRTGGCASCGVAPRTNISNNFSSSYYSNYRQYQNTNNYLNNYSRDNYSNNLIQSYVNNPNRVMTPRKNYSNSYFNNDNYVSNYSNNRNNYQSYHSPNRGSGCKSCSGGSAQLRYRSYPRPLTGNPLLNSSNNVNRYNMNRDMLNERYRSVDDNDNDEFTFKKNYVISDPNINDNDRYENNRFNRFKSPDFNAKRNLLNTRYGNFDRSINNNSNTNKLNNNIYPSNNLYNSVSLNNDYKKFLENNMNKYNYNRKSNNYYQSNKRNLYNSPSPIDYKQKRNDIFRSKFNYLKNDGEQEKNQYEYSPYKNERFFDLTQYNYKSKLLELIEDKKTFFVCVCGSSDYTGQSWCSDCNLAKPNIEQGKTLIRSKKYEKEIYFLAIPIDKIYMEDFRDDPYIRLERVPTLILFENGIEKGRLVENDLFSYQTIREFILQAYEEPKRRYLYERKKYYL